MASFIRVMKVLCIVFLLLLVAAILWLYVWVAIQLGWFGTLFVIFGIPFLLRCWNESWEDTRYNRIPTPKSFVLPNETIQWYLKRGNHSAIDIERQNQRKP